MAIKTVVQRGNFVCAYDGSRQLFTKSGTLHGYTATTVSVKHLGGKFILTYNEKGQQISCQPCR